MKSKEDLIPLLTHRAEELLRNAYNLGMKDVSPDIRQVIYAEAYENGRRSVQPNKDSELQMVYNSGQEIAWALIGSLAQTSKIKRRELFGCSRLSEIVILYTPHQVAQKLNAPMLIKKQTPSD